MAECKKIFRKTDMCLLNVNFLRKYFLKKEFLNNI